MAGFVVFSVDKVECGEADGFGCVICVVCVFVTVSYSFCGVVFEVTNVGL